MRALICLDIDGTVVSHTRNPSYVPDETLEALQMLKAAGHVLAFNTARSFATARKLMRELGIASASLCNGAHIVLDGKTVLLKYLDARALKLAARLSAPAGCAVYAADGELLYTRNVEEQYLDYVAEECGGRQWIHPMEELKRACKLDIYGAFAPDKEITDKACVIMEQGGAMLLPLGVSKASGLLELARRAGIAIADTVAVGDSTNDIDMIRVAGVGVAVGGAKPDVREAADLVADRIEDGGLLKAFRQLELI